jgi:hypothetical protein
VALSYALSAGEAEHGPHRPAVGSVGASYPGATSKGRRSGQALARPTRCSERHPLDTSHRSALEGSSGTLPALPNLPSSLPEVDRRRGPRSLTRSFGRRPRRAWGDRPLGVLHRRRLRSGQKRGECVGKTKRGKGTKIMAFSERALLFLSPSTQRALHRMKSPLLRRLWQAVF